MSAMAPTSWDEKIDLKMIDRLNIKDVLKAYQDLGTVGGRLSMMKYSDSQRKGFLHGLSELHKSSKFVDCIITNDMPNWQKQVHKVILSSHSSILNSLIQTAEENNQMRHGKLQVKIENVSNTVLEAMIEFMYTGEVTLSDEVVVDMFTAANRLEMSDLQRLCEEHVGKHISVDTVIPFMLDASHRHAVRLNELCQEYLKTNFKELMEKHVDQLLHLPKPVLIEILKVDLLRVEEMDLFKLVKNWGITRQKLIKEKFPSETLPSLKELVCGLIECIRFSTLPKKFLQKEVFPSELMSEEMMIQILFHKAKDPVYLNYEGNANYESQESEEPLPLYLRPRGNQWKRMEDFPNEETYATYLKSVLRPGMRLRAVRTYENVNEGDTGEFVQWNGGFPPCQVRWSGYGSTYWLHWRDLVICEN